MKVNTFVASADELNTLIQRKVGRNLLEEKKRILSPYYRRRNKSGLFSSVWLLWCRIAPKFGKNKLLILNETYTTLNFLRAICWVFFFFLYFWENKCLYYISGLFIRFPYREQGRKQIFCFWTFSNYSNNLIFFLFQSRVPICVTIYSYFSSR